MREIKQYGIFEIEFSKTAKLPVLDCACRIRRISDNGSSDDKSVRSVKIWDLPAFRKSEESYCVRFMPQETGIYEYEVTDHGGKGRFCVTQGEPGCHGVVTTEGDHFIYSDGHRFLPFGTTSYAWIHQNRELREQTLNTLKHACFNKIRMLLFPKYMPYNRDDPEVFPFRKNEDGSWNTGEPEFSFFDRLDECIRSLGELGIEADLILFHPYDRWGFSELSEEESIEYVQYVVARLGALHNVWWSLANEYEMVFSKTMEEWDQIGSYIREQDPYGHLISIHQILKPYPKKNWLTHLSLQTGDFDRIPVWKQEYGIPVIIDECGYEGNITYDWGNRSAWFMTDAFWKAATRGGYCSHGETFHRDDSVLWWGKGGKLYGESEPRIAFLKNLLESLEGTGEYQETSVIPDPNEAPDGQLSAEDAAFKKLCEEMPEENLKGLATMQPRLLQGKGWQLRYFSENRPWQTELQLPAEGDYKVEIIDVWNMTRKTVLDHASGTTQVPLPSRTGMAVLATANRSMEKSI